MKSIPCEKLPRNWRSHTTLCTTPFTQIVSNQNKKRSGKPRCTTEQKDKYIRVSSLRNRRLTSPQLAASLNSTLNVNSQEAIVGCWPSRHIPLYVSAEQREWVLCFCWLVREYVLFACWFVKAVSWCIGLIFLWSGVVFGSEPCSTRSAKEISQISIQHFLLYCAADRMRAAQGMKGP